MVSMTIAGVLSDDEARTLQEVLRRIEAHAGHNRTRAAYYEAHRTVQDLGISTPPEMRNIGTVLGWPGTVVDALEERLDLVGFTCPRIDLDSLGVSSIYDANELYREYSGAHTDAFIHGVSFLAVSRGQEGEPDPLITVESPTSMSAIYDPRGRRLTAAASVVTDDDNRPTAASLYLPDTTVHLVKIKGRWQVSHRDDHRLGRVTVRRLVNNPRASRNWGRSEITRPVIYYTDLAMRTLLATEVSREFYAAPQRWIMGAKEEAFVNPDGSQASPWQTYMGRYIALSRDEDADSTQDPKVGQFTPSSPTPYLDVLRMASQMIASEAAIPPTYLGFVTENPPSADGIRAFEARHVKRAARRASQFGPEWAGAIKDALLLRDGTVPTELDALRARWADPATPTTAATADATSKLIGSMPWLANSDVMLERLGFDDTDVQRLKTERDNATATALASALFGPADAEAEAVAAQRGSANASGEPVEAPPALAAGAAVSVDELKDAQTLKTKLDAMGIAIRAGVSPASAAKRLGLDGIEFTGAVPVSLRMPDDQSADLEER